MQRRLGRTGGTAVVIASAVVLGFGGGVWVTRSQSQSAFQPSAVQAAPPVHVEMDAAHEARAKAFPEDSGDRRPAPPAQAHWRS